MSQIAGWLRRSLICPNCSAELDASLKCADSSCRGFYGFPEIDGRPVMMPSAQLTLTEARAWESPIQRRKWLASVKEALPMLGGKPVVGDCAEWIRKELEPLASPRILVVGGATRSRTVREIESQRFAELAAFDIYCTNAVAFIADAHTIPLGNETVDCVIVENVLEHVLRPDVVVSEIYRVLTVSGVVYAETPFMQQVHEGSHDFTRFTQSGHRYLFRRFNELRSGILGGPATALLWSLDYLVRGLFRSRIAGKLVKLLFSWLPIVDRLMPESFASDSATACYFLGRKAQEDLSMQQIVAYYRGAD